MSDRISVIDFLSETKDDVNSPTTSTFTSKMSLCRATIAALEESLDADRSALKKMKNSIKAMHSSGQAHVNNKTTFIENLERLGSAALYTSKEPDADIGSAFLKMSVFTKELTALLKNMIQSINNILTFPLETLLKGDLKGVKGDMKRPFDKSWKDYDAKVKQVEREKRQLAKEAGMIRNEITGAEIAEEMEKERRMFQLQMCEYLIKANEIKTKKGVDFLQHLVEYYHAENMFFTEGFKVIDHFRTYADDLTANLTSLRQSQDEEKRQLIELRNVLKLSVSGGDNGAGKTQAHVYNLHQMQGNKALGNEKSGCLMKRSEGLRKAWQKRRCFVTDGYLTMSHNKSNKAPVKLNLLTSQLKLVPEDKKQFDLVSHNRTYRFMAEDEHDAMNWVSVLTNSKEDALNRVFGDASSGKDGAERNPGVKELTLAIIDEVRRLPGNDRCCDCNAPDPTWLSTNMGVLLCIECSGIHRDMGVHVSRIQSLTLDELGTSELLLARSIGNDTFNNIMEEKIDSTVKLTSSSDMEERKSFIRGKYISRKYVFHTCNDNPDMLANELGQAIRSCDMFALLQLFGENADLAAALPGYEEEDTALHVAVSLHSNDGLGSVLPLVDFLCQNTGSALNRKTKISGNTPLHICAENNKTECMKLLLRSKANTDIENANGETALAIAQRLDHTSCVELLQQANSGKFRPIVHIDIDWNLTYMDDDEFSDDDVDGVSMQGGVMQSPMKSQGIESRHRSSSFKDRSKAPSDPPVPQPPPRNAPAIPPHQNINRNRSQSMIPSPSLSDHFRSRNLGQPPALPAKPDNKSRERAVSSLITTNVLNRENEFNNKRDSVPEIPAKTAKPAKGYNIQHFASFGGRRRKPRPTKPSPVASSPFIKIDTPSAFKPKTASNSIKSPAFVPQSTPLSSVLRNNGRARSSTADDTVSLVSPRKVLKSKPSFAVKHILSTSNNESKTSPFATSRFSTLPARLSFNSPRSFGNPAYVFHSPLASKSDCEILTNMSPDHSDCVEGEDKHPCRGDAVPSSSCTHDSHNVSVSNSMLHEQSLDSDSAHHSHFAPSLPNEQLTATGKKSSAAAPVPSPGNQFALPTRPVSFSPGPIGRYKPQEPLTLRLPANHWTGENEEKSKSLPRGRSLIPDQSKLPPPLPDAPVPLPRGNPAKPTPPSNFPGPKRVRAIYDCDADNQDELTFVENEIIIVTGVEDQEWWVGHIEHQPHRRGVFPVSFVHILTD